MMMATLLVRPVSDEAREKFVDHLTAYIERELEKGREVFLSVDYGPCVPLAEAADAAGIPENNFPWKTCMWVSENYIATRYGYRAEIETWYSTKAHWQSLIESALRSLRELESEESLWFIKDESERQAEIKRRTTELKAQIEDYQRNFLLAED